MNLALSTVAIILGLLPGIVFWNSYLSGRFSRQVFGASTVSELAWYVVLAVPINAVALAIVRDDPRAFPLRAAVEVLTGTAGQDLTQVVAAIQASWRFNVAGYLLLIAASYVAGNVARRLVWSLRLDTRLPTLRMKHHWYYLLQGRRRNTYRQVLPYADVLVEHPEGSRLYRGLVTAFEPSEAGEIKELVLQDAQRGKGRGTEFKWADIPGERLILLGPAIHSINMRYVFFTPPKGWWQRCKYEVLAFVRSFLFEEP